MVHPQRADNTGPPASSQACSLRGQSSSASNGEQITKSIAPPSFLYVNPVDKLAELISLNGVEPVELGKRISVWHRIKKRKIVGNAAPLRRNLAKYIETHEQCEIYVGQEKWLKKPGVIDPFTGLPISEFQRAVLWNTFTKTKITGNFAPTLRDLAKYLDTYPTISIYRGQDLIEKAVKEYEEKNRRSRNRYRKRNTKEENMISYPLQARPLEKVGPVDLEHHTKLLQNQRLGSRTNEDNTTIATGIHQEEHVNIGSNNVSKVNKTLGAEITMRDDASAGRNGANPNFNFTDVLFDTPNIPGVNSDPSESNKGCAGFERSPSWSNLQLWRYPHTFHCPEHNSLLVSPSYAERSAVVFEDPINWIVELGDSPLIDRDNKTFKSLLENYTNASLNFGCNYEVELRKKDFLYDPCDLGQAAEADPIEYYLIGDDESPH